MAIAPAARSNVYRQIYPSLFREFECVRQEIFQHLLQAFRVGNQAARKVRISVNLKTKPPVLCLVTERPGNGVEQACEENFFCIDRNGTRFDLGEIENVTDQV